MTAKILLFVFGVVALSSCSVYKSGQTPDDVYYSPGKEVTAYVRTDKNDDLAGTSHNRSYDEYNEDYRNDRFLRLSMYDQMRLGAYNDYYWNSNLLFNSYYGYNSWYNPWNSYYYWNSFYNPYCSPGYIIVNPYKGGGMVPTPVSRPSAYYSAYVNRSYNNNNIYFSNGGNATNRISSRYNNNYNTGTSNTTQSNSLRRLFNSSNSTRSSYYDPNSNLHNNTNSNYNSNNSYSQPSSRSYSPSSSSSSGGSYSGGSSGSSGGGISRPGRN